MTPMRRIRLRNAPPRTLLEIYLSDHLAAAVMASELAKRAWRNNRSTDLEPFLRQLARETVEDREELERVMEQLGIAGSRAKQLVATALERLARAKLNGQLFGSSPLSRLVELDALTTSVERRIDLWRALAAALPASALPGNFDIERLIQRGQEQWEALEEHRAEAARVAFAGGAESER